MNMNLTNAKKCGDFSDIALTLGVLAVANFKEQK